MNERVDESPRSGPRDELHSPTSELRMATFRLARRLRAQRAVDTMSDGQFAVLAALSIHGEHTLGQLADRERVTAPSMNRTVSLLEEAGYLTRTPDDDDRRKVTIALTAGTKIQVDQSGVAGNPDGSVTVGLTSAQLQAQVQPAAAVTPAAAPSGQ